MFSKLHISKLIQFVTNIAAEGGTEVNKGKMFPSSLSSSSSSSSAGTSKKRKTFEDDNEEEEDEDGLEDEYGADEEEMGGNNDGSFNEDNDTSDENQAEESSAGSGCNSPAPVSDTPTSSSFDLARILQAKQNPTSDIFASQLQQQQQQQQSLYNYFLYSNLLGNNRNLF